MVVLEQIPLVPAGSSVRAEVYGDWLTFTFPPAPFVRAIGGIAGMLTIGATLAAIAWAAASTWPQRYGTRDVIVAGGFAILFMFLLLFVLSRTVIWRDTIVRVLRDRVEIQSGQFPAVRQTCKMSDIQNVLVALCPSRLSGRPILRLRIALRSGEMIDLLAGRSPAELAWATRVLQQILGLKPAEIKPAFPIVDSSPHDNFAPVLSYATEQPVKRRTFRIEQHDDITVIELPPPASSWNELSVSLFGALFMAWAYHSTQREMRQWPWFFWLWIALTAVLVLAPLLIIARNNRRRVRFAVTPGAIRMTIVGVVRTCVRQYEHVNSVGVVGGQLWWIAEDGASRCLFEEASCVDLDLLGRAITTALQVGERRSLIAGK